jgi:ABC-type transport system involved in cytochrome bd biosynthesis fused ATPase/permease subunit
MLQGLMKIRIANAESRMEAAYFDIARRQSVAYSGQTLVVGRLVAWFCFVMSGATALFFLVILLQWQGAAALNSSADSIAFASAVGTPTGRIELRDVFFRCAPDGPMVLKGLNVVIKPGTMVALTGPSGAGKSTITRLFLGFDRPERGQVLFDGRDLRNLDPILVRSQLGVVVQEGQITRGSIMSNILGATSTDEALAWEAADKAALADDIRNMPMGMRTMVDPGNISGGQAQRLLLARTLVRKPSILILDEATSALDNASQGRSRNRCRHTMRPGSSSRADSRQFDQPITSSSSTGG